MKRVGVKALFLEGTSVYKEYKNIYNKRERRKEFKPRDDSETSQKGKKEMKRFFHKRKKKKKKKREDCPYKIKKDSNATPSLIPSLHS